MKLRTPALAAVICVVTLSTSACDGGGGSNSASKAPSAAATSTSSAAKTSARPSSTSASSSTQPAVTKTVQAPAAKTTSAAAPSPHVGQAAAAGTTCYSSHRYSIIAVAHASCGFANNVGERAYNDMSQGGASDSDTFQAYSPATGQNYTVTCSNTAGDTEISCTGGNDAQIEVGLNTGF